MVGDHDEMEARNEESQNAQPLQRSKPTLISRVRRVTQGASVGVKAACQKGPTAAGAAVCFEAKAQILTALVPTADGCCSTSKFLAGALPK